MPMERTWDEDGSHVTALRDLPPNLTVERRGWWFWRCDCGKCHAEDEAQTGAILTCRKCGKMYVDEEL